MLKILQARLQKYMNQEHLYVQTRFWKSRRTRDQIANTHWSIEKAKEFQKNTWFCFIGYVDHDKLENSYRDRSTRPLHPSSQKPECTSRSNCYNGTWNNRLKTGQRTQHGWILSPGLLNLYHSTSCEMTGWMNHKLESNTGRKINNLRYADNVTLMTESEEELKSLLMRVKKLPWNSTFKKLRSWYPVPLLHGK